MPVDARGAATRSARGRAAGRRAGRRRCARRGSWPPGPATRSSWCAAGPATSCPGPGLELAGVARACGYGPDADPGEFLDDYRRTTRHARAVVEQRLLRPGRRPAEHGAFGTESPWRVAVRSGDAGWTGTWPRPVRRSAMSPTLARSRRRRVPRHRAARLPRGRLGGRRHQRPSAPLGVALAFGLVAAGAGLRDRPDLGLPHQPGGHPRRAARQGHDRDRGGLLLGRPVRRRHRRRGRSCSCMTSGFGDVTDQTGALGANDWGATISLRRRVRPRGAAHLRLRRGRSCWSPGGRPRPASPVWPSA